MLFRSNPVPGNALIRKDNPQMEDDLIAYGVSKIREHALVTGGDAGKAGIMTMTDDRWKQTASFMASAKLLKASTDYRRAYTLDLVKEVKVLP